MNMFDRFFRVVKSNVNSVISSLEDPEKVLEQAVGDMQNDLIKIRQSYAEVSATQKRMERQKEQADAQAQEWYRRAQLALQKGDEELAREALSRRQTQVDTADAIGKQLGIQTAALEKLYSSMTQLETKITEAKRQKDLMIARARTAKTSVQVTDMLSNISSGTNSVAAFDRMKEKVESLEVQAEVAGQLAATSSGTSVSLEEKFKALDSGSKVEDELEMLKRQLPGAARSNPQLPPSGYIDVEYENLKKELGR
jgi:phage shock protein A